MPEHVASVLRFLGEESISSVAVDDGAAKGDAIVSSATGAQREMATRNEQLKWAASRRAEERDRVLGSPLLTVRIVFDRGKKAVVPGRVDQCGKHVVDERLLCRGVEATADQRSSDIPMVRDERPEQPASFVAVIPLETNNRLL